MFGFTLANFVVIIPYILAFFTMFNVELAASVESSVAASGDVQLGSAWTNMLILSGFFLGAALWWLALTSIINIFRRGFRPRHMLTINHVAGIVISALGLYTLITLLIK